MLVGRIVNECPLREVLVVEKRRDISMVGSTIIVLIPEGKARLREDIAGSVNTGVEIPVVMGESCWKNGRGYQKIKGRKPYKNSRD